VTDGPEVSGGALGDPAGNPAGDQPADRRRRRTSLTGRAAILAVVIAALGIALAAPVRELIGQRAQISGLRAGVSAQQRQLAELQASQKLWADPSYVAGQAQERLHYVLPGKVPIIALAPSPSPSAATGPAARAAPTTPWYAQLWTSVTEAGKAAATPKVSPSVAPTPPS
jgi:cell division protein FtsB